MSKRQEDFDKAANEYAEKMCAEYHGDDADKRISKYEFLNGAEYGYQYAQTHPNWISVEERLPEEVSEIHHCSADVLIGYFANGDNYQTTARYNCNEKVWYDADDWGEIDFPTHWMPLPAAPRKEE